MVEWLRDVAWQITPILDFDFSTYASPKCMCTDCTAEVDSEITQNAVSCHARRAIYTLYTSTPWAIHTLSQLSADPLGYPWLSLIATLGYPWLQNGEREDCVLCSLLTILASKFLAIHFKTANCSMGYRWNHVCVPFLAILNINTVFGQTIVLYCKYTCRTEGFCWKVSIEECCCISNGALQHCSLSIASVNARAWWIASASSHNLKGLAHLVGASLLDVRYCELQIACCKILCTTYCML